MTLKKFLPTPEICCLLHKHKFEAKTDKAFRLLILGKYFYLPFVFTQWSYIYK